MAERYYGIHGRRFVFSLTWIRDQLEFKLDLGVYILVSRSRSRPDLILIRSLLMHLKR